MPYSVEVIADSVPDGKLFQSTPRLTTLAVTLPRIVLAELNTHRMFSRNSASSRAIPIQRMIDKVVQDPFIPFNGRTSKQPCHQRQRCKHKCTTTELMASP